METKHEAFKMFLTRILWNRLFSMKREKIDWQTKCNCIDVKSGYDLWALLVGPGAHNPLQENCQKVIVSLSP